MAVIKAEFAIIGGTGVYDAALLNHIQPLDIETPFGRAQATVGTYHGKTIAFMPRHGTGHSIPPHRINYRANLWALKELGVEQILATAAVGSLQLEYEPGNLVVVNDFLDFTKSRPQTFFEHNQVVHVDMSDPYCHRIRHHIVETASKLDFPIHTQGTYVCTEGPRFETASEIRLYQSFGGAVVGMTSVPEVILAKELEMCYSTVCMVTNYGTGISKHALTVDEVMETMAKNVHRVRQLFLDVISTIPAGRNCSCASAVSGQAPLTGSIGSEEDSH